MAKIRLSAFAEAQVRRIVRTSDLFRAERYALYCRQRAAQQQIDKADRELSKLQADVVDAGSRSFVGVLEDREYKVFKDYAKERQLELEKVRSYGIAERDATCAAVDAMNNPLQYLDHVTEKILAHAGLQRTDFPAVMPEFGGELR